jgi:TPR repeat protein
MQRWCADGTLRSHIVDQRGKRMVLLDSVLAYTPLCTDDAWLVAAAASGDAGAKNEIGVIFLEAGKPEIALDWFNGAAKAGHADAMHWLSKYFIYGNMGVAANEALGMSWLAAAAAKGHEIAKAQWTTFRIGHFQIEKYGDALENG